MLYSIGQWNRRSSYQELSFPNKKANSCEEVSEIHTVPFFILSAWRTAGWWGSGSHPMVLSTEATANNYRTKRRNQVCWQHPLAPVLRSYFRLLDVREKQTLNLSTSLFFKFQSRTAEPIFNSQLFFSFLKVSIFFEIIILVKFIFAFLYMSLL